MNSHFTAILKEYACWFDTLGYNVKTQKRYKGIIRQFFNYLKTSDIKHISQLNHKHIKTYFNYVQTIKSRKTNETYSITHLNDIFFSVDTLCRFLHDMQMSNTPTPLNYRIKADEQQYIESIIPLTVEEIRQLRQAIPLTYANRSFELREKRHQELQLIFALCYGCALRRTEAYQLTADNIDFDRKTLFVRQGKNYKDRIVPMSKNVCQTLKDYIYNFRNFLKLNHNRLLIHSLSDLHKSLKQVQQVNNNKPNKRLSFHVLRHSIATHLLQNGMSIEAIAKFLGHSSLRSTQIYTHIINR